MNISILQASHLTWDRKHGETLFANWAAEARGQCHRRHGHKSSKSSKSWLQSRALHAAPYKTETSVTSQLLHRFQGGPYFQSHFAQQ